MAEFQASPKGYISEAAAHAASSGKTSVLKLSTICRRSEGGETESVGLRTVLILEPLARQSLHHGPIASASFIMSCW